MPPDRPISPHPAVRPEYAAAFRELASRIQSALAGAPRSALPVHMYVAGGAAQHFYTGSRVSKDIDAVFSHRIALPDNLEVVYREVDGAARVLYFDRQYNDTLGLMHEDAHADSLPLRLEGLDPKTLDVRLLAPVDLAVSKLSRFSEPDRGDIEALARRRLITADTLRRRAMEAAATYIGNADRLHTTIEIACRIVQDVQRDHGPQRPRRARRRGDHRP